MSIPLDSGFMVACARNASGSSAHRLAQCVDRYQMAAYLNLPEVMQRARHEAEQILIEIETMKVAS